MQIDNTAYIIGLQIDSHKLIGVCAMLRRKALDRFEEWYTYRTKQALLVNGARQVGKTYLVREFARTHWDHVVEINCLENTQAARAIDSAQDARQLFTRLSAFADEPMIPGKTVVFIDEIQQCREAVTAIKFLMERGDFDYLLSGSMLGVELKGIASAPVGYLSTVTMYPLDLEEFCWAHGVQPEVLDEAGRSFETCEPVDEFVHDRLSELFWQYLAVGGMPDPVAAFATSGNLSQVRLLQGAIVEQYRYDISKYAGDRARVVRRIFDLMPSEISRQDKRFVVRDVEGDSHFDRYDNDFLWLADANVALPTYNVTEPRYPLKTNLEAARFKLFSSDVGLLAYQCGMDVVRSLAEDRSDINYGALYENAVAQELKSHGFDLSYYKDRSIGELDFVVQTGGRVVPIEVKSGKQYKRHSALTKAIQTQNWGIERAVVLHEGNVESFEKVSYLPTYMTMFLKPGF